MFKAHPRNSTIVQQILKISAYAYAVLPVLALLGWWCLMLYDQAREKEVTFPSWLILILGICYLGTLYNVFKMIWSNYRFKNINIILGVVFLIGTLIYQCISIFGYEVNDKFLPYSVFFLNTNLIVLAIPIIIQRFESAKDIRHMLEEAFMISHEEIDQNRDNDMAAEIAQQRQDKSYVPSFEDLSDLVTISKVSTSKFNDVTGNAGVASFQKMSSGAKLGIKIGLLVLSIIILAVYAVVLAVTDNGNKLGVLTAVSVLIMDLFSTLLYGAGVIENSVILIFLLLVNRFLMVGLGQNYWFYGYMMLYLCYATVFVYKIAQRAYPLESDIIDYEAGVMNLAKHGFSSESLRKGFSPFLLLIILSIFYITLIIIVDQVPITGITNKLQPVRFGPTMTLKTFWAAGLSLLTVLSLFLIFCLVRILLRKATRCEKFSTDGHTDCFKLCKPMSPMLWFMLFNWISFSGWGVIWYVQVSNYQNKSFLLYTIIGTPVVMLWLRGMVYYKLNDFEFFENVENLNKYIDKHNKEVEDHRDTNKVIRKQLMDGTLVLPPSLASEPTMNSPGANKKPIKLEEASAEDSLQEDVDDEADGGKSPEPAPAAAEQAPAPPAPVKVDNSAAIEAQKQKQKEMMEALRKKEEEKAKHEQQQREQRSQQEREAQLKQQQEMQEQMRLEQERAKQRSEEAERQRKVKEQAEMEQQRKDAMERKNLLAKKSEEHANKPRNKYDFGGQAQTIQEVSFKPSSKHRDDEIYEGGDDGSTVVQPENETVDQKLVQTTDGIKPSASDEVNLASIDPDEILIELDAVAEDDDGYKQIAENKLQRIHDWRLLHNGDAWKALTNGHLRPNDRAIIISFALSFFFWIVLLVTLLVVVTGMDGAVSCVPIIYIGICVVISSSVTNQARQFTAIELGVWIVMTLIYLGNGFAFLWINFSLKDFTLDVAKASEKQQKGSIFLLLYVLFIPTLAHILVPIFWIADYGMGEVWSKMHYFVITSVIGLVLILVSIFMLVNWISGVATLVGMAVVAYYVVTLYEYITHNFYLDDRRQLITGVLTGVIIFFSLVYAGVSPSLAPFQGLTISVLVGISIFWFYAVFHFIFDVYDEDQKPIYYSLSLFPIYKYEPDKGAVLHYRPTSAFISGVILITFWSFICAHQLRPFWVGPLFMSFIYDLVFLAALFAKSQTLQHLEHSMDYMTEDLVKQAWLTCKENYIKQKGTIQRRDLQSYSRTWMQRHQVRTHLQFIIGNQPTPLKPNINKDLREELWAEGDYDYMKEESQNFVSEILNQYPGYRIDNPSDIASIAFDYENRVAQTYMEEQQLIIQFLLVSLANAKTMINQERQKYFRFLRKQKKLLAALDITVVEPPYGSIEQRYRDVMIQVNQLTPEERQLFEQVKKMYDNDEIKRVSEAEAQKEKEKLRQDERNKKSEEDLRNKAEEIRKIQAGEVNLDDIDVNNMADCLEKYKLIVAKAKKDKASGWKYTDEKFVAGEGILGESVISTNLGGRAPDWPRMSEQDGKVLFKDGASYNDIIQGALGNCYFLSALGVLGNQYTRERFVLLSTDDEWMECGAICVVFFDNGNEDYIIIDDRLPQVHGSFVFTRSPNDQELWALFLEKAYAKKFGSYGAIEGGFVDITLSELTNGIPETIEFSDTCPTALWETMMQMHKEKAFLGAGSPSHPQGDSAVSPDGIVQGHAYSILNVAQVDDIKLVQLRNPHGEGEWTGDWSDDSNLWTKRMRNMLDYNISEDDGVFWMDLNNFMAEFECIYVCRAFNESAGWNCIRIDDKWVDKYAAGLPSRENKTCVMSNNPQYMITVTKPGTAYLVLRMKDRETATKAKLYGHINMQAVNGELITRARSEAQLAFAAPLNQVVRSIKVNLNPKYTYSPNLKLSMLVANMLPAPKGEGSFCVQFYTQNDDGVTLKKLN